MAEQIGDIAQRLTTNTNRPKPKRQPPFEFWKSLYRDLKAARTPEETEAVWQRYASKRREETTKPNRRQRRGATLEPVAFRPLDRNQRSRIMFLAERLDAKTHEPRWHGGCLKRTALQVLRILLFHFHHVKTGRLDPSLQAIARKAGVARSTVVEALKRLVAAGIVEIIRRAHWISDYGRKRCVQWTNAYRLNVPTCFRQSDGDYSKPSKASETGNRRETTGADIKSPPPMPENVAAALARLGNAIADRAEAEIQR